MVIFHNGKTLPTPKLQNGSLKIPLHLETRQNRIHIVALDSKLLKSKPVSGEFIFTRGKGSGGPIIETQGVVGDLPKYRKKYAIVIGISDYKELKKTAKNKNDLVDLNYSNRDAEKFVEFLNSGNAGKNWETSSRSWLARCLDKGNRGHIEATLSKVRDL